MVLRHLGTIYLKPEEVASSLLQVLPGSEQKLQTSLQQVEEELAALEAKHLEVSRRARRFPSAMLYGGEGGSAAHSCCSSSSSCSLADARHMHSHCRWPATPQAAR